MQREESPLGPRPAPSLSVGPQPVTDHSANVAVPQPALPIDFGVDQRAQKIANVASLRQVEDAGREHELAAQRELLQADSNRSDEQARQRLPDPYWLQALLKRWRRQKKWLRQVSIVALLALAGSAGVSFFAPHGETSYWNSRYVQQATDKFSSLGQSGVIAVGADNSTSFVNSVVLREADRDAVTTQQVRAALTAGDVQAAQKAMESAQKVSPPTRQSPTAPKLKLPQLTPELQEQVRKEQVEFYRVQLWDCCDEDGDVVEIVVNGQSYAVVPLAHRGALLSIPIPKGGAHIQIRGLYDGGGGITVGCRTDHAQYFLRRMQVNEDVDLGVTFPTAGSTR